MNKFININRVEFMITNKCTSNCKHCSVAPKLNQNSDYKIEGKQILDALKVISEKFNVESIMTFGGEPLLRAELVCELHKLAEELNIKDRHLITNGFFSKDYNRIRHVANLLSMSRVTEVCISVDAFHQEHIDIKYIEFFVQSLKEENYFNIHLHPAWVVNKEQDNPYNRKTKEILSRLKYLNVNVDEGNNISLNGNAKKYLREYYSTSNDLKALKCGEMPYTNSLDNVEFLTIQANGDLQICKSFILGNLKDDTLITLLDDYNPHNDKLMKTILLNGVNGLSTQKGISDVSSDVSESLCSRCNRMISSLNCMS